MLHLNNLPPGHIDANKSTNIGLEAKYGKIKSAKHQKKRFTQMNVIQAFY